MKKSDTERPCAILRTQRKSVLEKATRVRQGEVELTQDDFREDMDVAVAEPSRSFAGRLREWGNKLFSKIEETLELIDQGLNNLSEWHLVVSPLGALFATLMMVVFIGEAIREAFDPKVFSRLR